MAQSLHGPLQSYLSWQVGIREGEGGWAWPKLLKGGDLLALDPAPPLPSLICPFVHSASIY